MPENSQRLRHADVLSIVIIMVIVVAIPATTFLYVRSRHTTVKTPTLQPMMDATEYGRDVRKEFRTSDRTVIGNLQATRRSLNTGTIQDDYSVAKKVFANRKPTVVVRKNSINYERYPANHRNDNDVGDRLYRYIDGPIRTNQYEYYIIDADMQPVVGYYNMYDSSHNMGGREYYKGSETPVKDTGYTSNKQPAQIHTKTLSSSGYLEESSSDHDAQDTYGFTARYSAGHGSYSQIPSITLPSTVYQYPNVPQVDHNELNVIRQSNKNKVNRLITAMLTIMKLGLIKLKTIGIIQFLFLLISKIKLFTIAVFFKLLLIFKLIKFYKAFTLQLFYLPLLPMFTPMFNNTSNMTASQTSKSNNLLRSIFGNFPGINFSETPLTLIGSHVRDSNLRGYSTAGKLLPELFGVGDLSLAGRTEIVIPTRSFISDYKYDSHSSDRLHNVVLTLIDPILAIIRNVLKSENYVKKMSCRISVAEKSHIIPIWINWTDILQDNDRRQKTKCFTKALLTSVTIIGAVTFMYVQFGVATITTPILFASSPDGQQTTDNRGKLLVVTTQPAAVVNVPMTDLDLTSIVSGDQRLTNLSSAEVLPIFTSKYQGNNDTVLDNDFVVGPSVSESTALSFVVKDDLMKIKQRNHNKINRNDYMNTETDKLMVEEDVSTYYPDSYDLTYNVGRNGYNEDENPIAIRPEQTYTEPIWSESGNWDRPPYGVGLSSAHQPNSVIKHKNIPIQPKEYKTEIYWQKIGLLALIKFALFKLQTIGFLNFVFLLAFKFKLFMTGVFLKFLLILKLMKIYKSLFLPFFFLQLIPTFMQLLSIPARLMNIQQSTPATISRPNTLDGTTNIFRPGAGSIDSILRPGTGTIGTGGTSGMTGSLLPGVQGGVPGPIFPGIPGQTRPGGKIIPSGKDVTFNKIDDLNLIDTQQNEPLGLFDPTMDIYQTILDSEKCVERIACRIAVTEKGGVMPFWVNWMLRRVSNYIPDDKIDFYLQTFKDVNNEIYTMTLKPDNWTTWCSERYKCDNNKVSN